MSDYKSKKIWVVADIEDRAKNKAKELAKLDKKKIGKWLSDLILNKNSQSAFGTMYVGDHPDSSKDIRQIMNYLEKIHVEIHEIYMQLAHLSIKIHPLKKNTFFDKFFK